MRQKCKKISFMSCTLVLHSESDSIFYYLSSVFTCFLSLILFSLRSVGSGYQAASFSVSKMGLS